MASKICPISDSSSFIWRLNKRDSCCVASANSVFMICLSAFLRVCAILHKGSFVLLVSNHVPIQVILFSVKGTFGRSVRSPNCCTPVYATFIRLGRQVLQVKGCQERE